MDNPFGKIKTVDQVMENLQNRMTVMFGGFGGVGSPPTIIDAMIKKGLRELTLIGNDAGFPHIGIGKLVNEGRVNRLIVSHIGSNPIAGKLMMDGKIFVEFSPQGTLVERIRAGGVGIAAILTDVGMDNRMVAENKQTCMIEGKTYLVETALTADVSIVYAKKADPYGNLLFDKSARNTNPLVAMAGDVTIAEVEEIVPLGNLHPDEIITSGVFVDFLVQSGGVNWKWVWE
ncbi:CoA transferase subunit A [Bacillus sp. V3B]|uniref:CoA transferase subunit A n=1 Tax=Bacillus sp. V3B TaxID=2804915 RepID=UPI0021095530|nr:CoA transferase subunit A [Bacillus sp. V3B]MCQ6277470.1 CoA transferase subunit A [Bacillus sp. V3B]